MVALALAALLMSADGDGDAPAPAAPVLPGIVEPKTPPYLPRYATFQTYIYDGAVVPSLHLGWEIDLIEQPRNTFVFVVELGGGYTGVTPAGVGPFYEAQAMAGLGYRMTRDSGFHWGFTITFGGALYGNNPPGGAMADQRLGTYIEGKLHLGYNFGPVTLSLCGGWGQPLTYLQFSTSQPYAGGPFIGVLLGWK
jgi:hypothetical protein